MEAVGEPQLSDFVYSLRAALHGIISFDETHKSTNSTTSATLTISAATLHARMV